MDLTRQQLLYDKLVGLLPGQFAEVIHHAGMPQRFLAEGVSQAEKAHQVVQWADQSINQKKALEAALERVVEQSSLPKNTGTVLAPSSPSAKEGRFIALFCLLPKSKLDPIAAESQIKTILTRMGVAHSAETRRHSSQVVLVFRLPALSEIAAANIRTRFRHHKDLDTPEILPDSRAGQ